MRIPLSWLGEYVSLDEGTTAETLLADLVRVGIEEEAIHRPADELYGPIVVGQVLDMTPEKASNGKTVNWTHVRVAPEGSKAADGGEDVRGIVCGAHNFVPGDKVVVTLPGAVLPGDFHIAARKTYGHLSDGMIASARELGIGEDHDGILVLGRLGLDPEVGSDALELLHLGDEAAEVEITPDRGFQLSMRGIARSYSQVKNRDFTDPALRYLPSPSTEPGYPVHLEDQAPFYGEPGALRFVTREVTGIDPSAPVPPWLSSRLRLAGMRSVSLPVDISNYVMLELGQPLHFYDLDKLQGDIRVRRAHPGEHVVTLDGKDRTLSEEDLLITDDRGPLGIAGVMGGQDTEVGPETRNILIESAVFDSVSIGRTRRRHNLPSEAAKRYERGVDPALGPIAAERAAQLLEELSGGKIGPGTTDVDLRGADRQIPVPFAYPASVFGAALSEEQVERAFTQLGAGFTRGEEGWTLTPPSWRADLVAPEDVAEDVAILVGYENIPARLPIPPAGRGYTPAQRRRRIVAQGLADRGLVEVITIPFISAEANTLFGAGDPAMIKLANPISAEFGFLRTSLLPGLIEAAKRNQSRGIRDVALMENGLVFIADGPLGTDFSLPLGAKPADAVLEQLDASLPAQPRHLAGLLVGSEGPEHAWDWADAIDFARSAGELLGLELQVQAGTHPAFHPGRTAQLVSANGVKVGHAGELHPRVLAAEGLPERAAAFELDLDLLIELAPDLVQAKELSTYPVATQDVALVVDSELPAAELAATLREGAGDLLENLQLFDDYRGAGIAEGKKSLAFALTFRAPDRTLTADEASAAREAGVALAAQRYGAEQR